MTKINKELLIDKFNLMKTSMQKFDCTLHMENFEISILTSSSSFQKIVLFLKDNPTTDFGILVDMCAVDFPSNKQRFQLVYNFLSISQNLRTRLSLNIHDGESIESISSIYPCANWYEREIFDLFGISFSRHPDLRRILTDYDFDGYPLRKDFPMTGFTQVRYDEEQKKIITEPVKLDQEYRNFDNLSPWEGMKSSLSENKDDDEKN